MLTFNNKLFCGLLIGLLLGFLIHHKTYQNQLHTINQKIIDKIEPRRKQFKNKTNQLTSDKQYSQEIENLWKDFKQLFDKNTGLNPDFSFNEMVIEIRQLLGYEKGVAASTIKNLYQWKTNPRSKTIEAIQEWVNKEKKKEVESEDYEEDNKIQILIIILLIIVIIAVVIVKVEFLSECPKNR